jgi:hypothetical protein
MSQTEHKHVSISLALCSGQCDPETFFEILSVKKDLAGGSAEPVLKSPFQDCWYESIFLETGINLNSFLESNKLAHNQKQCRQLMIIKAVMIISLTTNIHLWNYDQVKS